MSWLGNLVRRARVRAVREGTVQNARVEAMEGDTKENSERWQDYGFTGHPVSGEGLALNWNGFTIVLRVDRLAERPQLAPYEVAVWHKEGHRMTMKAGGVVQVDCDQLRLNATGQVTITSPSVMVNGKQLVGHIHPLPGGPNTGPQA